MSKWRRMWTGCLALLAAIALTSLPIRSAFAQPMTFTWTGQSAPDSPDWSNGANWQGGVAPSAADGAVDLVFTPQCDPECLTVDDISGLSAQELTFSAGSTGSPQNIDLTGSQALTLDGDVNDQGGGGSAEIDLPLQLGGTTAQTWTIDGNFKFGTTNKDVVTGTAPLTVDLADGTVVTVTQQIEAGALSFVGANTADTGAAAGQNGTVVLVAGSDADLDGVDGDGVSVTDAALAGSGDVGPLTTSGADITVGSSTTAPGDLTVSGPTSALDAASAVVYPWDPRSTCTTTCSSTWPSLSATGSFNLGSALLSVTGSCAVPVGTSLVLASATQITGSFDSAPLTPITNGELIGWTPDAPASDPCPTDPVARPLLEVAYSTSQVTATAVTEPSAITLSASPSSPTVAAPFTLTATVTIPSPGAGTPTGTVSFSGPGGALCSNVALTGTTTVTATCATSDIATGSFAYTASYSGSSNGYVAASTSSPLTLMVTNASPPSLSAIPDAVDFSEGRANVLSSPVTIELTNNGPGYEVIQGMTFGGTDPDDYIGASDCYTSTAPGTLAPGASCEVELAFVPVDTGPSSAWLEAEDNEATPLMIPLSGVGTDGYYEATAKGQVLDFGDAQDFGDLTGTALNQPITGLATTPDGGGYWLAAADGGVFNFGDASFFGSMGGIPLNKPIVGIVATLDGGGYWLVASDGGVFCFGDANFYGSAGNLHLNKPIVGIIPTPDSGGYWLVASDGGVFAYGDAPFFGSAGDLHLNKPIVGLAPTSDGGGYWLVASDGGVFSYGDAQFYGSTGNIHLAKPIVGLYPSPDGQGYWLAASDGGVFNFGDAQFEGSGTGQTDSPVIGLAGTAPISYAYYLGVTPVPASDLSQIRANLRARSPRRR